MKRKDCKKTKENRNDESNEDSNYDGDEES
jgi:hypothetical protein